MSLPMHAPVQKPVAERRQAAVLFAELRGFARMSEALEAALAVRLAGEFFTLAAAAVESEGGETISVANDALFAACRSGDPSQVAAHAVRAALRIQREFAPLAEGWRQKHGLRSAVSIALHLGETLFGTAGPPGRERPLALGEAAAIAERLRARARAGEIVLSHEVIKVISPESLELDAEPLPPLELPKREPIRLYGVLLADRLDFTS